MSLQSHAVQQKYALLHYLLSTGRDPQMRGHVAGAVRIVDRHPIPGHKYNRDVRELFNFFVQNKLQCEFGGKEWWLGLQNIDLMLEFLQRKSDPGYKYNGRENFIVSGREDQLTTSDLWISFTSLSLDVQVHNLTQKTLVNRFITPTKTVPMAYKAITPNFGEPGIPSYRTPPENPWTKGADGEWTCMDAEYARKWDWNGNPVGKNRKRVSQPEFAFSSSKSE